MGETFTAYQEGSPMHPSWPAMHSAQSAMSFWLAVICDLTEEQWEESKKVDLSVAAARTVAGVHYSSDNIAGLDLGQEVVAEELPRYLAEKYGADPIKVQEKIEIIRFRWEDEADRLMSSPSLSPSISSSPSISVRPTYLRTRTTTPSNIGALSPSMTPTLLPSFYASSPPTISPIYCCSWNSMECRSTDSTLYCNGSQNNCVNDCGGSWTEYSPSTVVPSLTATTFSPTDSLTQTPTLSSTLTPTTSPTVSPTMTPTNSPTVPPTMTPTTSPTVSPTITPTISPTVSPTITPTTSPTDSPTMTPSTSPTYCCSWYGNVCGSTRETYCNRSQNNCESRCGGSWITMN